ncbi:MAG: HAD hydrolase family protein [Muribaculaceae bacterium]|nr:HAD hydrolase family protein [Muribaculaceae bacterium]
MKTLYVTDLDGTLLDAEGRVSARSAALLNEAIADGAAFTVATARTPATVAPLLADVDMRLPAGVMTGAALWNPKTGIYSDTRYISR